MCADKPKRNVAEVARLRKAGGIWLKSLREKRGLSQTEMAIEIGFEHYRFISQIENGRLRVTPDRYEVWAAALNLDLKVFVAGMLRFYDPVTHDILFAEKARSQEPPLPTPHD